MQNAKDTFYELLRDRLAALNPERTVTIRGVTRPGLVVDENEISSTAVLPDCFHLSWTECTVTTHGALPTISLIGEFFYATAGTAMNGGLDRGRMLAAMDGELLAAVVASPQSAPKKDFSGLAFGSGVRALGTCIWWSGVTFEAAKVEADRICRTARIELLSFQEAGEL